MANPERGEVEFEALGKPWTLRYSTNALCELEDHLDMATSDVVEKLQAGTARLSLIRAVIWAGLRDRHPEVTLKQAGDVMSDVGFAQATELLGAAFQRAFPDVDIAEADSGARPRKGGGAGTGKNSKSSSSRPDSIRPGSGP